MLTLVVVGLLSGLVTGLSPCVLPVLPGVLAASAVPAGSASGSAITDRRRPVIVVVSLVVTFAVSSLLGGVLLASVGLPAGLLRGLAIVVLAVVGVGLLVPPFGRLLERPFAALGRVAPRRNGSAAVLGVTLGLVFVPCAGPVLAAVVVLSATQGVSGGLIALTAAFAVGLAVPLLTLAILGQRAGERVVRDRSRLPWVRGIAGGVLVASALAIGLGATDTLQRAIPDYVAAVQEAVSDGDAAREALDALGESREPDPATRVAELDPAELGPELSFNECEADPRRLANCGPVRPFVAIDQWLNTPKGNALEAEDLRGKVVLVDFWTFGCINCQRTTPYLVSWDEKYRDRGLVVVGVHSPEFDYERDVDNVRDALVEAGIDYPVAIDNSFRTWREWSQRFWPARYLVDRDGVVRLVHYGEGAYEETERAIEALLDQPTA